MHNPTLGNNRQTVLIPQTDPSDIQLQPGIWKPAQQSKVLHISPFNERLKSIPLPRKLPFPPIALQIIWICYFFSHLVVNKPHESKSIMLSRHGSCISTLSTCNKEPYLILRVEENDILKAKIIKPLIVSHWRNGRVHVTAWGNTPTHHLFSHSHHQSPGAQTSMCTTGVNSVNCRESWTGITLNPCGISQTKAGNAYMKQCTQQCLEWSKETKANSTSLCSGFQQVPITGFSLLKKGKKNPNDLPLFSLPHFARIYQNQEARGSRLQKQTQTLHPECSCWAL